VLRLATAVRSTTGAALLAAVAALPAACNALVGAPDPRGVPPGDGGAGSDVTVAADAATGDADAIAPHDAPAGADSTAQSDAPTAGDSSADATDAPPDALHDAPPDATADGPDAASGPIVLVHDAHLGDIDTLAVYDGMLYGTNNGADPASGPVWSVSTSGTGFQYISPYNANINGIGAVRQMALSPPYAYFAVVQVPNLFNQTLGAWRVALDGSSTTQLFAFYTAVILAADPAGGPNLYVSDARVPGFVGEPKAGDTNPPSQQTFCNWYPASYPAPLQIVTDATGNVFWAYNGASVYGTSPPIVRQILQATPATVATWSPSSACNGYLTLVADVDIQGIGVDGANVYFSQQGPSAAIRAIPYGGLGASRLVWSSMGFPSAERPTALQSDGKYVYWVAGTEYVWAVAVDGSTVGWPIAVVNPQNGRTRITAMAFDDSFVYFADSGTYSIWKVAKPR
jgi:hypothetical protein